MSSITEIIGPRSGRYKAGPTPKETEDLPVHVNDELLSLGGIVNDILEGGAFPPQGQLPPRWREGMMMYFIQPLDDVYVGGALDGSKVITSAGIWLYRRERWWKMIDDPSSIVGQVFIYRRTDTSTAPNQPADSVLPPSGWAEVPPTKANKGQYIWASMSTSFNENTQIHSWSQPTIWSAGVEDGQDGQNGAPGIDGRIWKQFYKESSSTPVAPGNNYPPTGGWSSTSPQNPTHPVWMTQLLIREDNTDPRYPYSFPLKVSGEDGATGGTGPRGDDGTDGIRGTLNISKTTTHTSWNNTEATNAIKAAATDNVVRTWDTVTLKNESVNFAETRYWNGSTWAHLALFIDGDAIVKGTLAVDKLVGNWAQLDNILTGYLSATAIDSSTRLTVGSGNTVAVLSGVSSDNDRLWIGNANAGSAAFRVDKNGNLYANSGEFRGTIVANKLEGVVAATAKRNLASARYTAADIQYSRQTEKTVLTFRVAKDPVKGQACYVNIPEVPAVWVATHTNSNIWADVCQLKGSSTVSRNPITSQAELKFKAYFGSTQKASASYVTNHRRTYSNFNAYGGNNRYDCHVMSPYRDIVIGPIDIPAGSGTQTVTIKLAIAPASGTTNLPAPSNFQHVDVAYTYAGIAQANITTTFSEPNHITF